MKKWFLAVLAACVLLFGTGPAVVSAGEMLAGGWAATSDSMVTEEAQAAFEKATEGLLGADYEPLELLGTQVVAGTNYCLLCRQAMVVPNAVPAYVLMYIYQDLAGNAEILEIQNLEMGLSEEPAGEEYAWMVEEAKEMLKDPWADEARKYPDLMPEPSVKIVNTRVIRIAENPVTAMGETENKPVEELQNVAYIVEFLMLSNYYSSTYPCNAGIWDSVQVLKDGTMEVCKMNQLKNVMAKYYIADFSGIIEEIIDLGDAYDGELFD